MSTTQQASADSNQDVEQSIHVLVRYGAVPEVARFAVGADLDLIRGQHVVVRTHRGTELGRLVEVVVPSREPGNGREPAAITGEVLRIGSAEDQADQARLRGQVEAEFAAWEQRIGEWDIDLQLIDLESTLDGEKLILYVLNERGPECTKLALQAAAAGLGIIEVQPVSTEGLKQPESGGGCGSCGCGH